MRPNISRKRKRRIHKATISLELKILTQGFARVVGIDEAGRGPWAGPVSVAGFVYTQGSHRIKRIEDSKILSAKMRENLFPKLTRRRFLHVFGEIEEINKIGIGRTVENQIGRIVEFFDDGNTFFLIDGRFARKFGKNSLQIIHGDRLHYSIAAASIIAKVKRDRLMREIHKKFPEYAFDRNVGYPSKVHLEALNQYGPTPIHRKSFAPIVKLTDQLRFEDD